MRTESRLKAVHVAERAKRSRDTLHRLESGKDVTVAALMDILRATGLAIQIVPAGLPTMEQMRAMFADDGDGDGDG